MARIAFDVDDQVKQEIKMRLVREGQTLSFVMRRFCDRYKNFGLEPGQQVHWEDRGTLPDTPAVYFIYDRKGEIQYIGRTKSLRARLSSHHRGHQFAKLWGANVFWVGAPADILIELESWFIEALDPSLNASAVPYNGGQTAGMRLSEVTVSARIPRWLKGKLEEEAKRRLAPVSQIVREAIVEKLQRDVGWDDEAQRQLRQTQKYEEKQATRSDDAEPCLTQ